MSITSLGGDALAFTCFFGGEGSPCDADSGALLLNESRKDCFSWVTWVTQVTLLILLGFSLLPFLFSVR